VEWIKSAPGAHIAASLTFNRYGLGSEISTKSAADTIYLFSCKLNQRVFRNSSRKHRGDRKITFVAVAEGGELSTGTHLHYHAMIGIPHLFTAQEFGATCKEVWQGLTRAGREQNTFKEMWSNDWVGYILKWRTKASLSDCVDLRTFHIAK
jgi:hypothetical protein